MGSKLSREEVYGYINTNGHCPEWVVDELLKELEQYRENDKKGISIQTAGGLITAGVDAQGDYPGIVFEVDGTMAAVVEYDTFDEQMRVRAYTKPTDDPIHAYAWDSDGTDDRID